MYSVVTTKQCHRWSLIGTSAVSARLKKLLLLKYQSVVLGWWWWWWYYYM